MRSSGFVMCWSRRLLQVRRFESLTRNGGTLLSICLRAVSRSPSRVDSALAERDILVRRKLVHLGLISKELL